MTRLLSCKQFMTELNAYLDEETSPEERERLQRELATARREAELALRESQAEARKLSLVAAKTDNPVLIGSPTGASSGSTRVSPASWSTRSPRSSAATRST